MTYFKLLRPQIVTAVSKYHHYVFTLPRIRTYLYPHVREDPPDRNRVDFPRVWLPMESRRTAGNLRPNGSRDGITDAASRTLHRRTDLDDRFDRLRFGDRRGRHSTRSATSPTFPTCTPPSEAMTLEKSPAISDGGSDMKSIPRLLSLLPVFGLLFVAVDAQAQSFRVQCPTSTPFHPLTPRWQQHQVPANRGRRWLRHHGRRQRPSICSVSGRCRVCRIFTTDCREPR